MMDHALDHVVADEFLLLKTYLGLLGTMDYGPMVLSPLESAPHGP